MNHLQALSDLYREGKTSSDVRFSSDVMQQLMTERADLAQDGVRLWIEILGQPHQQIRAREDGKNVYTYRTSVVHAFEKDGLFYPSPGEKPFASKNEAIDSGEFLFLVDASQTVIGWSDDLTGNTYGEPISPVSTSGLTLRIWLILIFLVSLFVALYLQLR